MSEFYEKETEKSKWIGEGIKRERNRIRALIEKCHTRDDILRLLKEIAGEEK